MFVYEIDVKAKAHARIMHDKESFSPIVRLCAYTIIIMLYTYAQYMRVGKTLVWAGGEPIAILNWSLC